MQNPSQVSDEYWLFANRKQGTYPPHSKNGGKWLIFVPIERIDQVWSTIKLATEAGKLGKMSKVATTKANPNATNSSIKVICVYTYDWTDEEDVMRIRQELRQLGITRKIPYKADEDTESGKYVNRGTKRIAKHYVWIMITRKIDKIPEHRSLADDNAVESFIEESFADEMRGDPIW